jgi:actin-related protein
MAATTTPTSSKTSGTPLRGSPIASRRRLPRGRVLSSPGAVVATRSPVLLECSNGVLYSGYAGHPRAKRLVPVPNGLSAAASAKEYYRVYSPLVQEALELLGGGGNQDVKERRVVVLFDSGIYCSRAWKEALERILLHDIGVPACCFQPSIKMVPMAFPPPSSMLIVHVTLTQEAHCMAYAAGHALDYTYQVCSSSEDYVKGNSTNVTHLDLYNRQIAWVEESGDNNNSSSSLIRALLLCLAACPRETRRSVVHNMVFVGAVVDVKNFSLRVVQALCTALKSEQKTEPVPPQEPQEQEPQEEKPAREDTLGTNCPIDMRALQPLADHVSVVCIERLRPDFIPWLGASLWASHWHGINPESPHFEWITNEQSDQSTD